VNYPEKLTCHLQEATLCSAPTRADRRQLLRTALPPPAAAGRAARPAHVHRPGPRAAPHGPREEGPAPGCLLQPSRPAAGTACRPPLGRGVAGEAAPGGLLAASCPPHLGLTRATSCLVCIHFCTASLGAAGAPGFEGPPWLSGKDPVGTRAARAGQAVGAGLRPVLFICYFNLLSFFISLFSVQGRGGGKPSCRLSVRLSVSGRVGQEPRCPQRTQPSGARGSGAGQ
uniref:Uncharacterized protein n=1 Tax=Sciurus vulgaris TaxID=55149 RepID=A0A8D2D5Y6_SCIVU